MSERSQSARKGWETRRLHQNAADRWNRYLDSGGPTAHSPVDSYRCENPECPSGYEVWEFRPDDQDLDETAVLCPACGEEGEMFFRRFRGGPPDSAHA